MIVQRHPTTADPRVPYARMATAQANMTDLLAEHGITTPVLAKWTPSNERGDIVLEVWAGAHACVVHP